MPTDSLYDLAERLHAVSPWETLEETDLVRVLHPDTGQSGYISIMGSIGQHHCLALYLGDEALRRFHLMQEDDPHDSCHPEVDSLGLILETRQLQISFGTRAELRKDELEAIKNHGRRYRGDNWPIFRSFKPGYAPAPLDQGEIDWLATAIRQFLAVFPDIESGDTFTFREDDEAFDMLTRRFEDGEWKSDWTETDARSHEWATPAPSVNLLNSIRRQERLIDIDCHFQILPTPVGKPGSAVFPYLAISVEPKSGFVFGVDLLFVEQQTHEALIESVPDVFLTQWEKAGVRPASIRVCSITAYSMLEIAAAELNTPMRRANRLPAIERIMRELPL